MLVSPAYVGCRRDASSEGSASPVAAARPPAVPVEDAEAPEALLDRFMAEYFEHAPVSATLAGDHRHDGAWPDLSPGGIGETSAWAAEMQGRVELALEDGVATPELHVDLDIARNELARLRFELSEVRVWQTDPLAYAALISGGLDPLVSRPFAPAPARAEALLDRLEGLPTLVEAARANLSQPSLLALPHTEVGLAQLRALDELLAGPCAELVAHGAGEVPARGAAAVVAAREALTSLVAHIEETAARKLDSAGEGWRLGPDRFARKLALTLHTDMDADEVYRRAVARHAEVRGEMATLSSELWPVLFDEPVPEDGDARVRAVLEALALAHVAPEELRDAAEANLDRLARFVREAEVVPLDDAQQVEVIWTPPHQRGVAIAGLEAPPPLDAALDGDAALPSLYLVQPIPESWSASERESFLREYNHFMLEVLSIHEAIPGHFVQLYYGKRHPSRVRRVFSNGAFVEGWAVYGEKVMVELGYAGAPMGEGRRRPRRPEGATRRTWRGVKRVLASDELRRKAIALHRLKFYLRTVTNAMLDHDIHAGDMTEAEAMALMVDRSFQQVGEAKAKWVRARVTSTQLSTYFVGSLGWFDLRAQAEARAAASGRALVGAELAAFHAAALSHGAPPVHRLPALMWDGSPSLGD